MIEAVIFDFDGVIVESLDIKTKAFGKLFEGEGEGEEVPQKVIDYHLENSGVSRYDKFRYIYKEILSRPLSEDEFGSLCERFSHLVKEGVIEAPYVEGALEFLEGYNDKYSFFICSATPVEELADIVEKRKLSGYFNEIHGSPESKEDIVKNILKANGLDPKHTIYIGDAMSDCDAAKANAVNFIGRNTLDKSGLFSNIDCIKVDDLKDLPSILERHF